MPFSGRSKRVPAWRPRRCLNGCSGNTRGGSATGRSEPCNGGSNCGGGRGGPPQKGNFGRENRPGGPGGPGFPPMTNRGVRPGGGDVLDPGVPLRGPALELGA